MRIIMLGAPGAGKGTQAKKLAKHFYIPHISTGDIFRANIKQMTELGKLAKTYIDKGLLVPDEVVMQLIEERLHQEDCQNGYILDGFPRTIPQALRLDTALEREQAGVDYTVNIIVPDENIIRRMAGRRACLHCGATYHTVYMPTQEENICDQCGEPTVLREDDKSETVKKRLHVYHEQTQPLIEYYDKKKILIEVDGTKGIEEIFEFLIQKVGEKNGCNN